MRLPTKQSLICALKIAGGSIAAFVTFSAATPACPPNIFCTIDFGFQPRLDMWSVGGMFVAIALLLSACKDLISTYKSPELIQSDIESVAHRQDDDLDFHIGGSDS